MNPPVCKELHARIAAVVLVASLSSVVIACRNQPAQEAPSHNDIYPGFEAGLPTPEVRQKLYDELDLQRATQAVIWAEPAVNNALFLRAIQKVGVPNLG